LILSCKFAPLLMRDIKVVAVTGASGFIGAHIVKACLQKGLCVNACVRNKDDPKNKFLVNMAKDVEQGRLHLFSADLGAEGSFDVAFANADAVIHAAAQVDPAHVKDPMKDMVEPSTKGTLNVLKSVNKSSNIQHYVHTSSIAAVGFYARPSTEEDWNQGTIHDSPYNFAKTEAEKLAWRETESKPFAVTCINPTLVLGPCLAKHHTKASPYVFRQALYGNPFQNMMMPMVDVRDVARAHVEALLHPEAGGKRFIVDGDGSNAMTVNDLLQKCRTLFPKWQFSDAQGSGPDKQQEGFRMTDNSRSKAVLGLKYTCLEETIRDSVLSMVENGWVPAKPLSKL